MFKRAVACIASRFTVVLSVWLRWQVENIHVGQQASSISTRSPALALLRPILGPMNPPLVTSPSGIKVSELQVSLRRSPDLGSQLRGFCGFLGHQSQGPPWNQCEVPRPKGDSSFCTVQARFKACVWVPWPPGQGGCRLKTGTVGEAMPSIDLQWP